MDLHPAGSTESYAYGVSGGQQVGSVDGHAAVWSGTAQIWVDLNPAESAASRARGVSGGLQVGDAWFGGLLHAGMWSGTAASWVDLHSLLGAGYAISSASAIEVAGSDVWIVGYAQRSSLDRTDAVMWHYTAVPEPVGLLALGSGLLALGGIIRRRR